MPVGSTQGGYEGPGFKKKRKVRRKPNSVYKAVTKAGKQVSKGTRRVAPKPNRKMTPKAQRTPAYRQARKQYERRVERARVRRVRREAKLKARLGRQFSHNVGDRPWYGDVADFVRRGGVPGLAVREIAPRVDDISPRDVIEQLKKEGEGRGLLADLAGKGKKQLLKAPVIATGNTAPISATTGSSTVSGKYGDSSAKVFVNAIKDALDLPASVPSSVYAIAASAYEASVKGDTKRANDLWDQFKNHDAIALAVQGRFKEAGESAKEHPGVLALELSGAKAAVLRGPAAVARRGTAGKIAGTTRPPKTLEGTHLAEPRRYSKDPLTKARQKGREEAKRQKVRQMRDEAQRHESRGEHDRAHELREKAAKRDPDRVSRHEIERRVDERVQANEDIRRINRAQVTEQVRKVTVKKGGAAQALLAQNIIRADRADLAKYLTELRAAHDGLSQSGRVANRALQTEIKKALDNKKLDLAGVDKAAAAYRDVVAPLEKKLTDMGVLDAAQADRAKLIPYAVRNMGAKHRREYYRTHDGDRLSPSEVNHMRATMSRDDFRSMVVKVPEAVVSKNGKPLTNAQIRAHMKEHGVKEPAFVTQAPNMRGGRNFFISSHEPKKLSNARRTGEATRKGTFDAHPDTLVEGAARMQGLVDANDGFRGFIDEMGRREGGKVKTYPTYRDVKDAANNLNAEPGSHGWVPVRINPFGGRKEQLEQLLEKVDAEHQMEAKPILDALDDAVAGKDGPGPWALVPEAAASRLRAHIRVLGTGAGGKSAQLINSAFRKAVLSTSTKWAAGNVIEAGMRSAVMRAGPRSYATGRRVRRRLEEIDPKAARELDVRATGGGHYSMAERAHNRRSAEQFFNTRVDKPARALGAFWRTPGPKYAAAAWRGWTSFVFDFTRRIESQFQTAMAGKAIRDTLLESNIDKLSAKAIDQAARGLRNTNEQVALGRAVDRAYGRYSKWSPQKRQAIALYTPFVAWSLNAVKFVFDVLPRDHPVLTGLLAASHVATEEWRKEHGLGKFIDNAVPAWLQGSVPTKGGGHLRVGRYLPFGAFADPLDVAASAVLPQYRGVLMAFQGMDWKGTPLRNKDGSEYNEIQKAIYGSHEFLKATVPALGQAERVTAEGGSLKKEFNPFEPVKPQAKKKSGGYFDSGDEGSKTEYFKTESKTKTNYFGD